MSHNSHICSASFSFMTFNIIGFIHDTKWVDSFNPFHGSRFSVFHVGPEPIQAIKLILDLDYYWYSYFAGTWTLVELARPFFIFGPTSWIPSFWQFNGLEAHMGSWSTDHPKLSSRQEWSTCGTQLVVVQKCPPRA